MNKEEFNKVIRFAKLYSLRKSDEFLLKGKLMVQEPEIVVEEDK